MSELLTNWEQEEQSRPGISDQAIWFFAHAALAVGSWLALMLLGYVLNPQRVSQWEILAMSAGVPLLVGFIVTRMHEDEMAGLVWLAGLIWLLMIGLWILDLPTGPNACFQCDATEKLMRAFFNLPRPSGLMDDDGPFIATWPAAALVGYSVGARLATRSSKN
jgi:hypothetical protein